LAKQQELAKQKLHVWRKREWEKDMGVPLLIWNFPFWGNYLWEFRFSFFFRIAAAMRSWIKSKEHKCKRREICISFSYNDCQIP